MKQLDKWDIQFIQLFKSNNFDCLENIKQIWCERCALDMCYVEVEDIFNHLMSLAIELNLVSPRIMVEMIENAQPKNQWKFVRMPNSGKDDYYINWLRVIISLFRLTEVKNLPGYVSRGNCLDIEQSFVKLMT